MNFTTVFRFASFILLIIPPDPAHAILFGTHAPSDPRTSEDREDNKTTSRPMAPSVPECTRKSCTDAEWRKFVNAQQTTSQYLLRKGVGILVNDEEVIQSMRDKLSLPSEISQKMAESCKEGSPGTRINCLRQAVQAHFKDGKNLPAGYTLADCKVHTFALESALKQTFKASSAFEVGAAMYNGHVVVSIRYIDPESKKEFVYTIDSNNDRGTVTDLRPVNQTAIDNPIPPLLARTKT